MNRHIDAQLMELLSKSVPPPDVTKIDVFNTHLAKYHQKARLKES